MIEFLYVLVIVIAIILFGLLVFIWNQLNNTNSRLVNIIEDRIRLNNVCYELGRLELPILDDDSID